MRTPGRTQVQQDSTCSRKPFVFKLRKPQQTEEAVANATASPEFDTAIQGNKDFEAQRSRQEQPVNDVQPQKHMVRFLTSFPIFIHCLCFKIYKNHFEPQNSNQDASEEMTQQQEVPGTYISSSAQSYCSVSSNLGFRSVRVLVHHPVCLMIDVNIIVTVVYLQATTCIPFWHTTSIVQLFLQLLFLLLLPRICRRQHANRCEL